MFPSEQHAHRILRFGAIAAFTLLTYFYVLIQPSDGQCGRRAAVQAQGGVGSSRDRLDDVLRRRGRGRARGHQRSVLSSSFNVLKGFSVFFDSTNYYGRNRKGSLNGHGFTFGVGHGVFPSRHVKPNFFAESGVVRTSSAGSIVDQFAFASGLSFSFPFNRHVELALTPAEWVFLDPNEDPRNDYNAKVGIVFPFRHR